MSDKKEEESEEGSSMSEKDELIDDEEEEDGNEDDTGGEDENDDKGDEDEKDDKGGEEGKDNKGGEDEQDDEHKKFVEEQEQLLEHVKSKEESLNQIRTELKPCDSCEIEPPYAAYETRWCCNMFTSKKKKAIEEMWIIAVPVEETALDKLYESTVSNNLSINYKFHIPELRAGTMNELIYLSEELSKLDVDGEQSIHRLLEFMDSVVSDKKKLLEVEDCDVITYITKFTWNVNKYPIKKPLSVHHGIIRSIFRNLEDDIKRRQTEFNELDATLHKVEQQLTGNLFKRSLADIVTKDDFILDSKYMTTLIVVVPINSEELWYETYMTLADMVVPQSTKKLFSDDNHCLFNVIVYKKCVNEFKENAREYEFVIRDFEFDEEKMKEEKDVRSQKRKLKEKQLGILSRWLKTNFNESFMAWMHVKALRVFVESVLRYGLFVKFQAMLLVPLDAKKLSKKLNELFEDLSNELQVGTIEDIPGGLQNYGGNEIGYSYVFVKILTADYQP